MEQSMKEKKNWSMVGRNADTMPLSEIDISHPGIWREGTYKPFLARLRRDAPVHYCAESAVGSYWSITKYRDIMHVDTSHDVFSSEPTIGIIDAPEDFQQAMFIAMDPPKHDEQRKAVQGAVAPPNLKLLEGVIRERAAKLLDACPVGEEFNWVDYVSVELTTQMLATLFDFPFEDRHLLTYWSDVSTAIPGGGIIDSYDERETILQECAEYFGRLFVERSKQPPKGDFISMLAHSEATKSMPPHEFLGNLLLLIVGGNDTTRNSISGGVLALNENPAEYDKLRANPTIIPNMVSEIIRWQTPLAHMRRTANMDVNLGGQTIKKGDKVIMWYASGNLDDEVIENADQFIIDRKNARQHLSFGFGIHRCMGNRLAEMQLRIVWEEIMKRFSFVEVVGEPQRIYSSFVKGYTHLPVKVHPL
ncbi:cytochrome P450 [Aurantivibrio plasticivorans]